MPTGRVTALQLFGFSCLLYDVALTMLRWWCFVDDFQDWGRVGWDVKRLCILADAGDVALMMSRWGRCLVDNVKGWVGVDCTGHCQRQRQSLESKAAYIHVLLYVPKKSKDLWKDTGLLCKASKWKSIWNNPDFGGRPPKHRQTWDKMHVGLPNSYEMNLMIQGFVQKIA